MTGSPPRAWGIRPRRYREPCGSAVHPHVRGEYDQEAIFPRRATVHPHVRGEYWWFSFSSSLFRRFTPTCVGNTLAIGVA